MHTRFDVEGKPGVTTRSGSNYSTWWNGGLRTMPYFHNQVGLLTESIGNPTPETIGFVPDRVIARGDLPFPIVPQVWHFRQSIDYSMTANYAVLDFAQRYRENLLFNIYAWPARTASPAATPTPGRSIRAASQEVKDAIAKDMKVDGSAIRAWRCGGRVATVPDKYYSIAPQARVARSARLHHLAERRRLPDRDQVRQHHDQERPDRASRHGAVHRRRQAVSGRLVRLQGGAGVPSAPARHVRAAGSPERLPVSRRPADSAVRQRRLDARLPDGPEVRSRARRVRRPVREDSRRRSSPPRARSPTPPAPSATSSITRTTTRSSPSIAC